MKGVEAMEDKLRDFIFQEGLRQDSVIHGLASQLGTKAGLYMVFAGFVFSAEATLVQAGQNLGLPVPKPLLGLSLFLSLVAIVVLLRSVFIQDYKTPPILPKLESQSETYLESLRNENLSEEEKLQRLRAKFTRSLGRSIAHNFELNRKIAVNLEWASRIVASSILTVLVAVVWGLARWTYLFFLAHRAAFHV
ncbi:MAG: hypothetical protein ACYDHE_14295 [Candidatus Acidiferrales bacterium]